MRDSNQMALESSRALEEVTRLKAELHRARIELEQERQRSLSPAAVGDLHLSADREKVVLISLRIFFN